MMRQGKRLRELDIAVSTIKKLHSAGNSSTEICFVNLSTRTIGMVTATL